MFVVKRDDPVIFCCCGDLSIGERPEYEDMDVLNWPSIQGLYEDCETVEMHIGQVVFNLMAVIYQNNKRCNWTHQFAGDR